MGGGGGGGGASDTASTVSVAGASASLCGSDGSGAESADNAPTLAESATFSANVTESACVPYTLEGLFVSASGVRSASVSEDTPSAGNRPCGRARPVPSASTPTSTHAARAAPAHTLPPRVPPRSRVSHRNIFAEARQPAAPISKRASKLKPASPSPLPFTVT